VPLIPADNVFAMGTVLIGLAWLGFWIDNKPIGRKTSGVVWVLVAAMLLSNTGVTPISSPSYDFVGRYMVSLAIPLLLFKADIRKILRESGKVMVTFLVGSVGVVLGAVISFWFMDLGEIGPKVAGTYTGGWIGGAVNFLAVSQVVGMSETEFASAISASSVVSILALMMLIALPSMRWVLRFVPTKMADTMNVRERQELRESKRAKVYLRHLTGTLALSFGICAVSAAIGSVIGTSQYDILFVTVLTLFIANIIPKVMERVEGEFEVGMIFMYVFFAMIGSSTDATAFIDSAIPLFVFGMSMILIHIAFVLVAARLLKIDLAEAVVASAACLVGPAPTAAIAITQGWRTLVTPGIMCGIFGYAIGTFIGVALTGLLN
jgi:uncharacterized membrane protein